MKTYLYVLVLFAFSIFFYLQAEQPQNVLIPQIPSPDPTSSDLRFVKNKGQWGEIPLYKVRFSGGDLWLCKDRLTFSFVAFPELDEDNGHFHTTSKDLHGKTIKGHVYSIEFKGANPHPQIIESHLFEAYHNYFLGNDPDLWASNVPQYGLITYKDIYPNIDFRIYGLQNALKYEFIVHPGGDPNQIQLVYNGADKLKIKNNDLHIKASFVETTEQAPFSYQYIGGEAHKVPSYYRLKENHLSFDFPDGFQEGKQLVIDPTMVFSTKTGSFSDNWGFSATYDLAGNAYSGGIVYDFDPFVSTNRYPTTNGAFQRSFQGGISDVVVSKFNETGNQLLYSTYIGGRLDEQPHSLIVNNDNELYILGRSNSTDFPTSLNAYDRTLNGSFDLFVFRLSADGRQLLGSTFIGGSGADGVNFSEDLGSFGNLKYNYGDESRGEIQLDQQGSVYIVSPSQSDDYPVSFNAFQRNFGGAQDGVVTKLRSDLTDIYWSSYLGGSRDDAAYGIVVNEAQEVYITGGTESFDFPVTNDAVFSTYRGGRSDGFIIHLNPAGSEIMHSSYIGTTEYDQAFLVQLDQDENVYLLGQSLGSMPIVNPPSGPVYFNPAGGQFISKLSPDLGTTIYQTRFGSGVIPNISPTAFLVDICGNVYATGWGGEVNNQGTTANMPITGDAVQARTDGSDVYMIVLSRDAQALLYGSYLGGDNTIVGRGEHLDGGTCRFDPSGVIYHAVCADCGGINLFPTTPGVYSRNNRSDNCNLALFKMSFDFAGVTSAFVPRDTNDVQITGAQGCAPFRVRFDNTSVAPSNNVSYLWDFGNGNTSTDFEPTFTFNQAGLFDVMLITTDPTSCNLSDTAFRRIEVFEPPTALIESIEPICPGDSVVLQASGGVNYQWSPATAISDTRSSSPSVFPDQTTNYNLILADVNGCRASTSVEVEVRPPVNLVVGQDTTYCSNGGIELIANVAREGSYSWEPANLLDDPSLLNPMVLPLAEATTFTLTATDSVGCSETDSLRINLLSLSVPEDTTICEGESVPLLAQSQISNISWTPVAGIDNPGSSSITASPAQTTTYTATAILDANCQLEDQITVRVSPIPTAFAGDDQAGCPGDSFQLNAIGGSIYEWQNVSSLSDISSQNPIATPSLSTTYVVRVGNSDQCFGEDSVFVYVGQIPLIDAGNDTIMCQNESIQLFGSGGTSYQWEGDFISDRNSPSPFVSPNENSTYRLIGINADNCTAMDSVFVEVIERPVTVIQGLSLICPGEETILEASGGESFLWSTGETTESITVSPSQSSTFYVTATNNSCDGNRATFDLLVSENVPNVLFTADQDTGFAPSPITFLNLTEGATRYEWDFGTGGVPSYEESPIHIFASADNYTVTLTAWSEDQCESSFSLNLRIENLNVFVPSAFSPNLDGQNDQLYLGQYGIESIVFKLFNRWGHLIFETDELDFKWNGTYNGREVQEGVYTYLLEARGLNGTKLNKAGTITILK